MLEKKMPNFSKSCPKSSQCSFYLRVRFFKIAQKVAANHLGFFGRYSVAKNFQKSPNLVTLILTYIGKYSEKNQIGRLKWVSRYELWTFHVGCHTRSSNNRSAMSWAAHGSTESLKDSFTLRQKRSVFALVLAILSLMKHFFRFIKPASLRQKRRVCAVV